MLNDLGQTGISTNDTVLQVEFQVYSFGHWGHLHINIYINAFFIRHPIWQTFQAILKMADWVYGPSSNLYTFCGSVQYGAEICLFRYADVGCLVQWVWCVDPYIDWFSWTRQVLWVLDCGLSQAYIRMCMNVEECWGFWSDGEIDVSVCSSMPALSPTADVIVINSSQSQDLMNPVRILTVMFILPTLQAVRCLFITVPVIESSV